MMLSTVVLHPLTVPVRYIFKRSSLDATQNDYFS